MASTVFIFLLILATSLGQEVSRDQGPSRSYSQAANTQLGVGVQQQQPAQPATAPPKFSYAQAARGSASSASTTTTSPALDPPAAGTPPTPPPRSYAQASGNSGTQNRPTPSPQVTTWRPRIQGNYPSRGGAGGNNQQNRGSGPTLVAANVTDDELRLLSDELLRSDSNNAAGLVRANWQSRTYGSNPTDVAPLPLLNLQARVFQGATIAKLKNMYDNYEPDSGVAEVVTAYERDEDKALLDAIVATQVMAKTRKFLVEKGLIENNAGSLRNKLQALWFTMYPRHGGGSAVGSSAFEHIFLAEVKKGEISGFHNWLYFAHEESVGKADYMGHIRHIDLGGKGSLVKHHFKWGNITKPVGSMFIGTSPELEMALYTVCFLTRPDNKCAVRLAGEPFFIKTHSFTYRGSKYIGSAFPDI